MVALTDSEELAQDLRSLAERAKVWEQMAAGRDVDGSPVGDELLVRVAKSKIGREQLRRWQQSFDRELRTIARSARKSERLSKRDLLLAQHYAQRIVGVLEDRLRIIGDKLGDKLGDQSDE